MAMIVFIFSQEQIMAILIRQKMFVMVTAKFIVIN